MIYLLCMLAGCRLLKGRFKALAAVGCVLCLMLLAMVGWKSVYAIVMLAGCGCFTEAASSAGPVSERHRARNSPIVFMI